MHPSSLDPDDPLAGTPYSLVRLVSAAGMGEVIEAEHRLHGYRVIVKLVRAEHFMYSDVKNRMRLEAHATMRVQHENLVRVLDSGDTIDGRTFLVMERLQGRTLADELKARGHIPVVEAIQWTTEALAGLSAAHAAGLLHRDVKPDNLFVSDLPEGGRRLKVLDFGVAKILDAASQLLSPLPHKTTTAEGITVGTPLYFSPEQAQASGDLDARTDVYAMGCALYELLCGKHPFHMHRTLAALARAHVQEVPPPPSMVAPQTIPAMLDRVVMRAMAKRREDRFENAEAFRGALRQVPAA